MRYPFFIIILLSGINSFSQKAVYLQSKISGQKVLLRWAVNDAKLLADACRNGFVLKKIAVKKISDTLELKWETAKTIHEFRIENSEAEWKNKIDKNKNIFLLYNFLNDPETGNLFNLILLSADIDREFANEAGLFYKDSLVSKDSVYCYRIDIANSGMAATTVAKHKADKIIPAPQLIIRRREVTVNWNFDELKSFYSSYWIERSDDSISFTKIHTSPFVPLKSQFEENKTKAHFIDSTVEQNRKYWYRMIGVDFFGERSQPSVSSAIKIHLPFPGEIIIDTLYQGSDNKIELKWHLTNPQALNSLKIINVERAEKIGGSYQLLSGTTEEKITIELHERNNFIRLCAISNDLDTISSWPEMYLLPDNIPPAIPDGLSGKIDKSGIVTISWNKNTESDFKGFRVFRSNSLNEEFVEATDQFLTEPEFQDSITLNTLTEEIYYSVNAVDLNFNNSNKSVPVKLEKPDLIPPQPAPIKEIEANKKGNFLRWSPSGSMDVETIQLLRSSDQQKWEIVFYSDSVFTFLDTTFKNGKGFYYKTNVLDDAGNNMESEPVYLFNDRRTKNSMTKIEFEINRKEKFIRLFWDKPELEVESYQIYRAKKDEQMRLIKSITGDINSFMDSELYIGNSYQYLIIVNLPLGQKINLGEISEVIY